MERLLSELVEKLQRAHPDRLVSVVLYGSAAVPNDKDAFSDYNVLCVLKTIGVQELADSQPVFRWWREMRNPSPLLLSHDEVITGTDCFPIEFHDIKESHRILAGADVVKDLEIDDAFYRSQVEHELRAKLLRLRQKAGGVLSESDLLVRMMADSVSTFCVLFRHALRLANQAPKYCKREVIASSAGYFGIDPQPFSTLLDIREEKSKPRHANATALFSAYMQQIEKVVEAVDRMER